MTKSAQRWDLILRYRLIEIIALWEGRLTTKHLMQAFGIGRQQASKHINTYNQLIAKGNLVLDKQLKGYRPSDSFACQFTQGTIDEYLNLLSDESFGSKGIESMGLGQTNIQSIHPPLRNVKPEFVRAILEASRNKKRVEIQYASLNQPEPRDRMIAPHTLVFNGYRWHVRAFCEESLQFKDFLLSRMTDIAEITLDATQTEVDDKDWNTLVDIIIAPDPRLNEAQKQVIANDFAMINGELLIQTRATLIAYYLQHLRIDKAELQKNPAAQQIVVVNRNKLKKWWLPD